MGGVESTAFYFSPSSFELALSTRDVGGVRKQAVQEANHEYTDNLRYNDIGYNDIGYNDIRFITM